MAAAIFTFAAAFLKSTPQQPLTSSAAALHALLARSPSSPPPTFESLSFFRDAWQSRAALHLPAATARPASAYYGSLLASDDLDELLCTGSLHNATRRAAHYGDTTPVVLANWSAVRLHPSGKATLQKRFRTQPLELGEVHAAFGGWSLVLNRLNLRVTAVARASAALATALGFRVNANAYLTPPRARAFAPHFDWMESLVVQVEGSKTWRLWENDGLFPARRRCAVWRRSRSRCDGLVRSPHAAHRFAVDPDHSFGVALRKKESQHHPECRVADSIKEEPMGSRCEATALAPRVVVMLPGDALYIPAGVAHEAEWRDDGDPHGAQPSLHLTFGVEVDAHLTVEAALHTAVVIAQEDAAPGSEATLDSPALPGSGSGAEWSWAALLHAAIAAAASPRRNDALALRLRSAIAPADSLLERDDEDVFAEFTECVALLSAALADDASQLFDDALRVATPSRAHAVPIGEVAHLKHLLPRSPLAPPPVGAGQREALREGLRAAQAFAMQRGGWVAVAARLQGQARDEMEAWRARQPETS